MRIKPYWTTLYLHSLHHLHNTKQYNKESKHDIQVKPSYHIKKQPVQTNKSTSRSSIKYKTTSKPIIQLNYKVMHCKSNYISTIRNKHAKKITPNCRHVLHCVLWVLVLSCWLWSIGLMGISASESVIVIFEFVVFLCVYFQDFWRGWFAFGRHNWQVYYSEFWDCWEGFVVFPVYVLDWSYWMGFVVAAEF